MSQLDSALVAVTFWNFKVTFQRELQRHLWSQKARFCCMLIFFWIMWMWPWLCKWSVTVGFVRNGFIQSFLSEGSHVADHDLLIIEPPAYWGLHCLLWWWCRGSGPWLCASTLPTRYIPAYPPYWWVSFNFERAPNFIFFVLFLKDY